MSKTVTTTVMIHDEDWQELQVVVRFSPGAPGYRGMYDRFAEPDDPDTVEFVSGRNEAGEMITDLQLPENWEDQALEYINENGTGDDGE